MTDKIEIPRELAEVIEILLRPSNSPPEICNGSWDEWEVMCLIKSKELKSLLDKKGS